MSTTFLIERAVHRSGVDRNTGVTEMSVNGGAGISVGAPVLELQQAETKRFQVLARSVLLCSSDAMVRRDRESKE